MDKIAFIQTLPYSEVCMHMNVAGKSMLVSDAGNGMAQLHDDYGNPFSAPITYGEAGVDRAFFRGVCSSG